MEKQFKKQFFLLFLLIPCLMPAQGQLRSELNLPRIGDELIKEEVAFIESGKTGENQTWDFSKILLSDDVITVNYFNRAGDFKIIGAEKGKLSFLNVSGDSLMLSGYENPNTLVRYSKPGLLLHFPIEYRAVSQGRFEGRGKHHDRLESIVSGEIHTAADASGIIILPGNDTLYNVIRLHIRKTETSRFIPLSYEFNIDEQADESLFSDSEPQIIITDTYQWYEEGYRYPVFETIETYRKSTARKKLIDRSAYFYHPAEQGNLPEDKPNQVALERKAAARNAKLLEKAGNIISFTCFPNPVKNHLTVELNLQQPAAVDASLWDMNGRLLRQFPSKTDVTLYRENLNMQSYPPGHYLLKLSAGKETISEKIVKN